MYAVKSLGLSIKMSEKGEKIKKKIIVKKYPFAIELFIAKNIFLRVYVMSLRNRLKKMGTP